MTASASISYFPDADAQLRVFELSGDNQVVRYTRGPDSLGLHLGTAGLRELHAAIGKHLHQIDEAARKDRLHRAAYRSHLYTMKYRPAHSSHLPEGLKWQFIERPRDLSASSMTPEDLPISSHRYGIFVTERPLTVAERLDFEIAIVPVHEVTAETKRRILK